MTYDASETSAESGAPIELYTFSIYGQNYRYTTASEEQLVDVHTYEPAAIQRSEIEESGEIPRNNIEIRVPETFEIVAFFDPWPPSEVMLLQILRVHRGGSDPIPYWSGRVLNVDWQGGLAVMRAENIYTSLRRQGLRRKYSRNCPHVLYSANACRAVRATFAVSVAVTDIDGRTITVSPFSGFPDGRFAGGDIAWQVTAGQVERRGIKSQTGAVLELTHPIAGLTVGQTISAAPGCAHDLSDCETFFSNEENYGGFPYFQDKNPMGGNTVF